MELKMKQKKPRPLGEVAAKPTEREKPALSPAIAGALPEGEPCVMRSFMGVDFVGYILFRKNVTFRQRHLRCGMELAFCSAKTFILTPRFFYTAEMLLFGRGTCGAAWNSLFVPQKLSSPHHDFLIPWKGYIVEPIGWWAPAVRLGTRFLSRENFHLHTTM